MPLSHDGDHRATSPTMNVFTPSADDLVAGNARFVAGFADGDLGVVPRLHLIRFLPHKTHIRGFVYEVTSGTIHEVTPKTETSG